MQVTLTEGIAGSKVRLLPETWPRKMFSQIKQVVKERLANAMADQRFRSKMAQVAAICGMDEFNYDNDDAKQQTRA